MKKFNYLLDSILGKMITTIIPTIVFYCTLKINPVYDFVKENGLFFATLLFAVSICFIVIMYSHFKKRIVALKKFRDKEMMRIVNHFNVQLNTIEDRLAIINDKGKYYTKAEKSIDEIRLEGENQQTIVKEISDYNEAFSIWGCGNYTKDDTKPLYDKIAFDIKTPANEPDNSQQKI